MTLGRQEWVSVSRYKWASAMPGWNRMTRTVRRMIYYLALLVASSRIPNPRGLSMKGKPWLIYLNNAGQLQTWLDPAAQTILAEFDFSLSALLPSELSSSSHHGWLPQ